MTDTADELAFKPDFPAARARWEVFWRGESRRPMLHAIRPKPGVAAVSRPRPYDCAFGELDPIIEQALGWAATHEFMGDAIPSFMVTFAPDHFAALLGGEIETGGGTGTNWVKPCLRTLADAEIRFRPEGRWWRRTVQCAERFRARCDGRLIVTGTHLQGGLDCLAALYGAQPLMMDMALAPDTVRAALGRVDRAMRDVREAMADLFDVGRWGSLNRFGMYSSGLIDVPQCDASCMISREMFDAFARPSLAAEVASADASVYHLDGADAVQHLESICSIGALDMIQWMPGAGHYDDDHRELNRRIDALGKGQVFQSYYRLTAGHVSEVWRTFDSRKLFFQVEPSQCDRLLRAYGDARPAA